MSGRDISHPDGPSIATRRQAEKGDLRAVSGNVRLDIELVGVAQGPGMRSVGIDPVEHGAKARAADLRTVAVRDPAAIRGPRRCVVDAGAGPGTLARTIHLPLAQPAIFGAALLIFVDCLKELPATLLLRPFNFNTLSTRVYELASLERIGEAAPAALVVVASVTHVARDGVDVPLPSHAFDAGAAWMSLALQALHDGWHQRLGLVGVRHEPQSGSVRRSARSTRCDRAAPSVVDLCP